MFQRNRFISGFSVSLTHFRVMLTQVPGQFWFVFLVWLIGDACFCINHRRGRYSVFYNYLPFYRIILLFTKLSSLVVIQPIACKLITLIGYNVPTFSGYSPLILCSSFCYKWICLCLCLFMTLPKVRFGSKAKAISPTNSKYPCIHVLLRCFNIPLALAAIDDETNMRERLSFVGSRAHRVERARSSFFPLFAIKDGGRCKGSIDCAGPIAILWRSLPYKAKNRRLRKQGILCLRQTYFTRHSSLKQLAQKFGACTVSGEWWPYARILAVSRSMNLGQVPNFIALLNGKQIVRAKYSLSVSVFHRLARKLGSHLVRSSWICIVTSFIFKQ